MNPVTPFQFVVVVYVALFCYITESRSANDPIVGSITPEQKKEIEKIRLELQEALENDEQVQAGRGIIVQPKWLQGKESIPTDSKVVVTKQGLDEVKALRDQIQKAVADNVFVASVASSSAGDTQKVIQLQKKFDLQKNGSELLDTLVTSSSSSDKEIVGSTSEDDSDFSKLGPNIADSYSAIEPDIDIKKLQRLEVSKRRTREVLVLKSIEEDFSFDLGEDVMAWVHIIHAGQEYFIGQRQEDLLIVRQNATKYERSFVLNIGETISCLETYSFWNMVQKQQEGVIIVALLDRMMWFRVNQDSHRLELYWEWNIGFHISCFKYFRIDSKTYLAVGMKTTTSESSPVLNIYQFILDKKEFWIAQHLPLQHPFSQVSFLDTGRDFILAIAQNNTAAIFTFNPNVPAYNHLYFQLLRYIPSTDIERITAFKMGGHSYLALGGRNPQILLYQQGDFISKTILGQNFGLVELFFPIPVRTYRDDLILLVQHRVEFSTHTLTVLETLIWNGDVFETAIPVPCHLGAQTVYGVSCMLDINRDEGLKGAALLRRGSEISVIVPRQKAESGLFRLNTELLAKNSELIDLKEIFSFLKDWVKEQDDFILQARAFLEMPDDIEFTHDPDLNFLESLKTPELSFKGEIGEIYVNDYKWTEQDTNIDLEFLIQTVQDLEADLKNFRHKRDINPGDLSFDSLDFDLVEVENLFVDKVNFYPFYIQNKVLNFDGLLNLQDLEVLDEVNARVQRQLEDESVQMSDNLEFKNINGIPWESLKNNIAFRTSSLIMDDLDIEGEIICEDSISIKKMNSLDFPSDYLWSSGPTSSLIKAQKNFTKTLASNAVDTDGLINGVNPIDAITLYDEQFWSGRPTFVNLEVSEKFELNGTSRGENIRSFPSNPILEESKTVQAACMFHNLEVQGPIFIQNELDGLELHNHLKNVISKIAISRSVQQSVTGHKVFSKIEFPVDFSIEEATLRNISVHEFIPKHTKQNLNLSSIEAYVYFNNLTLAGVYDGVKLENLLEKAITIDKAQSLPDTQLNFVDILQGQHIDIKNAINGNKVHDGFQTIEEPLQLPEVEFVYLETFLANIPKNIVGNASVNGINLNKFLTKQNWNEPNATGNIFLKELFLAKPLQTDELHGIDSKLLLNFLKEVDDLPEMILAGTVHVDHILITGDILVHHLNGLNFDEDVQMTVIWLNRPNFLNTNIVFNSLLEFHSNLSILGDLNEENMVEFIDDLVFKTTNDTIIITAPKRFLSNVEVHEKTKVVAINSLLFENIANKKLNLNFNGNLQLTGNLIPYFLEIKGALNEFSMMNIEKRLQYDPVEKVFILSGDNNISRKHIINDFTVVGNMESFQNISNFFENLVYKDQMCVLKSKKTFTGRVTIEKGAYIRNLNSHNLPGLLNNIVMKSDVKPAFIKSPVNFGREIDLVDLSIKDTLSTKDLKDCSLKEWITQSLRVDQSLYIEEPLTFAPWSLDGNSVYMRSINGRDLDDILPLSTVQNITKPVNFSEIHLDGEIIVNNLVNQVDLRAEFENTLLTHGKQHVKTPLSLQSLEVLGNFEIKVPANGDKNLSTLAMTNENIHLKSPLFFQTLSVKNLRTNFELSGVNLQDWLQKVVLSQARFEQVIQGNWTIDNLVVHNSNPFTDGTFDYESFMRYPRAHKPSKAICYKVKNLKHKSSKQRTHFIKHLDKSFILQIDNLTMGDLRKVFSMENEKNHFLLLNGNCKSSFYVWNITMHKFTLIDEIETGRIKDVNVVSSEERDFEESLRFMVSLEKSNKSFCDKTKENFAKMKRKPTKHLENIKMFRLLENKLKLEEVNGSRNPLLEKGGYTNTSIKDFDRFGRSKQKMENKYSLPLFYKRTNLQVIFIKNTSDSDPTYHTFEDFKDALKSILDDLNYRLNLEINITQLSIPETDLYDEHLVEDFIAIVHELQNQKYYPSHIFSNISLDSLEIPGNPAQVLAARTVQIVWPVIVEIEEIHAHVKDNTSHNHPSCMIISKVLGSIVSDVLNIMRDHQQQQKTNNYDKELNAVIERIRSFQNEVERFGILLTREPKELQTSFNLTEFANIQSLEDSQNAVNVDLGLDTLTNSLYAVPIYRQKTGSEFNDAVNFYFFKNHSTLFQSIETKRPHSLLSIRLHNESLFAFVENANSMRVLIYRGIQGFVDFSKFQVDKEQEILHLFKISLPFKNESKRHYLGVVLKRSIVFYEIVISGVPGSRKSSILCL